MSERPLLDPLPRQITDLQRQAANPESSIWVEANAGSGKTRVLTDRVLRLMLAGVAPDNILCLTYTKAAAAEMRQRVSDRLAAWALQDDAALRAELLDVMDRQPSPEDLERARTLFAHALETPGGLKIQTIHAFCEAVLHRFPVEAGVPFDFAVLEDHERDAMILHARETVLAGGLQGDGAIAEAVETLFALLSDHALSEAIDTALGDNRKLRHVIADRDLARRQLRTFLGLPRGETMDTVHAEITGGYPFTDADHQSLFAVCPPNPGGARFEDKLFGLANGFDAYDLLDAFLTKDGAVPKNFPKKDIVNGLPGLAPAFLAEAQRLEALRQRLTRAALFERSSALLDILGAISSRYEAEKRARSLLDFDDLVDRLAALLRDEAQGLWVRYKLDGGITHILVDESQDTNPEQWRVIDAIVDEFFAGDGAVDRPRTLFAVGDGKQSIYSFQGADPALFLESGRAYERRAGLANRPFARVRLHTSFRTLLGVLGAVDTVFADEGRRQAVLEELAITHETARRDMGGTVTLWPPVREPDDDADPEQWPLEIPADFGSAPRRVATRIASEIAGWIQSRRPLGARGRPVRADDVLILVQSRSTLFHELIRSLHRHGLATPGADRLNVTSHIAVLDLLALGDVLLNPADDLQLAALLRSPLFNVSEEELFALANPRAKGERLWDALAARGLPAYERLHAWRGKLDFGRPYEFFAEVLGTEGGLKLFHERLGREVDDVFAEFLDLALAHEQSPQPSLQGFLAAMREREVTIKRELNERGGGVRVMTVHGAKGLEAPIVILADAASKPDTARLTRPVYIVPDTPGPLLIHANGDKAHTDATRRIRDADIGKQRAEYWRKLYVAMTRAEDELYVTGALTKSGKLEDTWYEAIDSSLRPLSEAVLDADGNETELRYPRDRLAPVPARGADAVIPLPLPLTLGRLPKTRPIPFVRPSSAFEPADEAKLLETAAEAVVDAEGARQRGIALHALLQHLGRVPRDDWDRVAARAMPVLLPDAPDQHVPIAAKAVSILSKPGFAHLFGPNSRAEVPFLANALRSGGPVTLAGRIDRLVVEPHRVLVVDFKSDADATEAAEAVKPAYKTQLGLYALVASQLFPGVRVDAAILWTSLELLLELPRDALAEAAGGFTMR